MRPKEKREDFDTVLTVVGLFDGHLPAPAVGGQATHVHEHQLDTEGGTRREENGHGLVAGYVLREREKSRRTYRHDSK